ncbi:MAG: DUF1761 domain-containing protein [Polyangiales bacterium]|nr:DUF1761 domain-containing protein [Sandaracinaceae bacterium]
MSLDLAAVPWLAVLASVFAGQVVLTLWFVVLFPDAWARAYGGPTMTKEQHRTEVPPWTYGVGAACTATLSVGLALLRGALGVSSLAGMLALGGFVALVLFVPMALPAYAFTKRYDAFLIGAGSQVVLSLVVSAVLALVG